MRDLVTRDDLKALAGFVVFAAVCLFIGGFVA